MVPESVCSRGRRTGIRLVPARHDVHPVTPTSRLGARLVESRLADPALGPGGLDPEGAIPVPQHLQTTSEFLLPACHSCMRQAGTYGLLRCVARRLKSDFGGQDRRLVIDTRCSNENFEEPLRWPMAAQSGMATGVASGSRVIVHDGTSEPSIGSTLACRLMA